MEIKPLKNPWKIQDHQGDPQAIKDRVDSESNLTWCIGWPLASFEQGEDIESNWTDRTEYDENGEPNE